MVLVKEQKGEDHTTGHFAGPFSTLRLALTDWSWREHSARVAESAADKECMDIPEEVCKYSYVASIMFKVQSLGCPFAP